MNEQRYNQILKETLETMEMMKDHDVAEWIAELVFKLEAVSNLTNAFLAEDE